MKHIFKKSASAVMALALTSTALPALAAVDLSPWKNPAGRLESDLSFSGPVQDGNPIQVTVTVYNRGDSNLDTLLYPLDVRLRGNFGNITTDADATGDIKTIMDGTIIPPNGYITVPFLWTPNALDPTTQLQAIVDPNGTIAETNEANNLTIKSFSFSAPVSEYSCGGYTSALDKDNPATTDIELLKVKGKAKTIPVKTKLLDENGFEVTDMDIATDKRPVIQVTFESAASGSGIVDDSALLNPGHADDGNQFTYDLYEQNWQYFLGTKGLAEGTYTITMKSADTSEYTINEASCSIQFQKFDR
jgi:hypothetical protein